MGAKAKIRKKIRKILLMGIITTIYGILITYFVNDFEVFFLSGFLVLMVDATVFWAMFYLHRKYKETKENEEQNSNLEP